MKDHGYRILVFGEMVEVDLRTWGDWFSNIENRRVARTEIDGVEVSTVFLGVDHSFGHGEPLWYETMIFGGEHDQYQDRYTTLEEAMRGHERAVAGVRGEIALDE